ncbi:multifunctional nuclease/2',3'-cyclic-nucleotide 2'-phosphodiesterase/5'-nucleotidase/3'-nucleotidase [Microbacterium bovistercoris]|uniref:Multifunctional nuclease/2',3'-cyclic-nucleotide 2'-phosphodiesterase/5'-nucleotidase/3'-nucleotidase n=1 Tax=Microbacterium bovistercoris TaxID=2293570 RepID=A0A371NSX7_9MICO|nr:ExeM/NucH family extracellular endonuclease [Microbacterium bovistercoris]REJ05302.1 multifunctional nuclease/2',3'-cyclic-nucleotide 2'-phosphodiesterase/5'-nucleotidase/3'-nucleotidase [Microbacterium bovistercoris]
MMSAPDDGNRQVPVPRRRGRTCALVTSAAVALSFGSIAATPAFADTTGTGVVINEAYLSGGSDGAAFKNKFVELYNPTSAPVKLDGMSIQYRSATGTGNSNGVVPLTGTIPAKGYFLVSGNSNGANGAALPAPDIDGSGKLSPSGTKGTLALVKGTSAIALPTGSVTGNADVVDLLGYQAKSAEPTNTFETAAATGASSNQDVKSLNRTNGADSDDNSKDFSLSATITPQGSGGQTDPGTDPEPSVKATIAEVQGTADKAAMDGQNVSVEGVITADHRTGGYDGIVIQTAGSGGDKDATPGASDGVFVYLKGKTVPGAIGDLVSVTGVVGEYYGQTQITPKDAAGVTVVTPGVGTPKPAPLATSVVGSAREAYENMLVAPAGDYLVASSHQLYNYGTLWLNPGVLNVKSTELKQPGAAADAIAAANRADRILLDDGYSIQIGNEAHPGDQPYFTEDVVVRNGDAVDFGDSAFVLQYGFNDWRLQPATPLNSDSPAAVSFTSKNPRTEAPEVGGDLQVASFNVYNYFTTLSSENEDARGAEDAAQFAIQKSKIVAAIGGLDAEIVSLMEIENSAKFGKPVDTALADLVSGLNAAAGSEVWAYVPTPKALADAATTDYIKNAIIYKKKAVKTVGQSSTISDESVWDIAREPIAQTFKYKNRTFTIVANHFKSKGGDGAEPADGQGRFNAERVEQAKSVLKFTDQLAKTSGSDDMLLIGDFNAYSEEDPIDVFTDAGWSDLVADKTAGQYTYTFDGELGSLDHVIASPSLKASITGAGVWGINSPEWSDRGYAFGATEAGTPYRSSDHDPILVGIAQKAKDVPVSISIATINDFHGRIEADGASAGAAVLAGAVEQVRDENPNTIFAAAGDLIGASTFTSFINDDNPTIDALNAAGLDVSAAGNHEFDQGWEDLRDRVQDRADWEYISSNVFVTETGEPALAPAWVKELDGVRVGFVGAVTEELDSLVSPEGIKDLEVRSIVDSVNDVADDLTDGKDGNGEADVVILLVHEGATTTDASSITPDSALGEIVYGVDDDVDAIVSAHTHLAYNHVIDGRPVVSAGQYGENLGVMSLQFEVKKNKVELLSIENEIRPLAGRYPADPEVQAIVAAAKKEADVLGAVKVGNISAGFTRARQSDGKENRGGESTIGNFVADVQQWATGADLALMNPGGIRADLAFASSGASDPDGNVTYREAATVQPFANTLVTLQLTGAQLKSVLEEQWQPDGASRPFLKLGVSKGLTYTYDPSAAKGARITSITLNGTAIDPAASYTVAANSFLAAGGDNFTTLAAGTGKADTGKIDLQSMVDWFAANAADAASAAVPDLAQRAVGATVTPAADSYQAGQQVTVALSSLSFSAGEQKPTAVSFAIGDTQLGTASVNTAIVDTTDEVGKATFTFTVPAGAAGKALTVTPDVGAAVTLPLTFG